MSLLAVVRPRMVPLDQTSGTPTTVPASSSPAMITISPLGPAVVVGYHRPRFIFTDCDQAPPGSKMVMSGSPWSSEM